MGNVGTKGKDFRDRAQGFAVCFVAILIMYILTGMNVAYMEEIHFAALMAIFTTGCAYYVTGAFIDKPKKYFSLLSVIPAFVIYLLIFKAAFEQAGRDFVKQLPATEGIVMWAGLGTIAVSVLALVIGHRFTSKDLLTVAIWLGFHMRTVLVLFTPVIYYQHDVSLFTVFEGEYHDDYIMYIYENLALPNFDIRNYGQFYHPPLHYLVSAIFLKIHNALPFRFAEDFNGLKFLPMLSTSFIVLFIKKILEYFKINGKAIAVSMLMVVFCPQMIFLSSQVNNDALALMLFVASFYLALQWYSDPDITKILLIALSIGCAMMTKLSMGFVALPVAWLFAVRLVRAVKDARAKKDRRAGNRLKGLIKQFAAFAAIVFPLGLWFPIRNNILFGTPLTYVTEIDSSSHQDVWMYSVWQRLFFPSKELILEPFISEGDYNIFLNLIKTGLFDERRYWNIYLTNVGRIMMLFAFILIISVIACAFISSRGHMAISGKNKYRPEYVALWILALTLVGMEYIFCFRYPVVCSQAFRYIAPVLIPAAVWIGSLIKASDEKKDNKPLRIFSVTIISAVGLFALSVILFYGPSIQYYYIWDLIVAAFETSKVII